MISKYLPALFLFVLFCGAVRAQTFEFQAEIKPRVKARQVF